MLIEFLNFKDLHNDKFKEEAKKRIGQIIDDNSYVEGKYNFSTEKKLAEYCQSKHALLVANGTDALEISLQALGVSHGDLVGVPGVTFYATAEAVINMGAIPVFIDVDPLSGLLDPESLKRVIKDQKLKAIIPVHIYGLPAPMKTIESICEKENILIVEDAAQAIGADLDNYPVGGGNNLTTFSFYPTKNISAFGDAGAILTNDDDLAEKIKSIRNHGRSENGHALIGRNSRCDHIHASILDLKLESLSEWTNKRREVATVYHQNFKSLPVDLVDERFLNTSCWHLYPFMVKDHETRNKLNSYLRDEGIHTALFYMKALSEETPLEGYNGESKVAVQFRKRTLCLPLHQFLSPDEIQYIIEKVRNFFKTVRGFNDTYS
jgi:dTDP-4-amino-4,6-dideoxygalactose transaminase